MVYDFFPDKISKGNTLELESIQKIKLTGDDSLWNSVKYSSMNDAYQQFKKELEIDRETRKTFESIENPKTNGELRY